MPLALEPNQSFDVVLPSDKDKPAESRPTFVARTQSMRGQRQVLKALDDSVDVSNDELTYDRMFTIIVDQLERVLVGWRNMGGVEFSREGLEEVLSFREARELLSLVAYNQAVQHEEKKS